MSKELELVELPREEVVLRSKALAAEVKGLVASKKELVDIVLDALISAYAQVADESGRLAETPVVLRMVAARLEAVSAARPTTIH
jgi:hypothetical protein